MSDLNNHDRELQRLKSAVEELTLLNELALAASVSVDVNKVLDIIIAKSIKAVRAEQGSILLVTPQEDSPLKTLIRKDDFSGHMAGYKVGATITGWVLKNKQPLIIEDLANDQRFRVSEKEIGEIRTALCVPVITRGEMIGVLTLTNKKTGEPFSQNDLRLISILAAQSGQLIHNSQLQQQAIEKKKLEHQLDLAREMQINLVPKRSPQNQYLEIASYFSPADAVGGDYFDYFELNDNKLGVVIADVSGHGPHAALVMTMIKGILHSMTHRYHDAAETLREVNAIVSKIIPPEIFITMQFLVFDFSEHSLSIANAGHNPVLHYVKKDRECRFIDIRSCALNVVSDFEYSSEHVKVNSGDIILIYTDGINEAVNQNNDMFSISRLRDLIEKNGQISAAEMVQTIRKQVEDFSDSLDQADDMILIATKIV